MRYSRIIAAFVFTAALIFSLCFTSFAAAETKPLTCYYGVSYFQPLNSTSGKWEEYYPTVSTNGNIFTFSNLPNTLVNGNYEYSFSFFSFLMAPSDYSDVEFTNGYVYTFDFTVRSTRLSDPSLTAFEFGVCTEGYNDATPLADVVYTTEVTNNSAIYYVTVTVNVDDSFPANSLPYPSDAYYYLRIASEWTDSFQLRASNLTVKKSIGEGAYYQASIDAIENLPQSEYDYILNKMPDDQGYIDTISGDLTIMHNYFISHTDSIAYLYNYLETARPCMFIPDVKVPFFKNLNIVEDQIFYFDTYLDQMNTEIMPKVNIVVIAIRIFLVMTFLTTSIWKMVRVEWWL